MAQAYLYPKKRSPYWYIQYVDGAGVRHDKSTGLRRDDPNDTLKAKRLRAELEAKSYKGEAAASGSWDWVAVFLERHCKSKATSTLERYTDAWKWVALWLQEQHLHSARQLTYKKAITYLDWRLKHKKKSGKAAGHNTALLELKVFSMVLDEAVRLEEADGNPLSILDVKREPAEEKPEMTEEEIRKILAALPGEPKWMHLAFLIALHTGCRLRETRLHVANINLAENKITFGKPKGGRKRAFSIPIPQKLKPLLEQLKKDRQGYIFEFPFQPSRRFGQFLHKLQLDHVTFHCTRVTFITRMRRAGVPREVVMRLVNHANELIHRIYEREKVEDLIPWTGKVEEAMDSIFQGLPAGNFGPSKTMGSE